MVEFQSRQTDAPPRDNPVLISRFSIVLLAFTLLGIGIGTGLPPEFGSIALGSCAIGILTFTQLELLACRRYRESVESLRSDVEERLAQYMVDHPPKS